ncbi:MAG: hypothetical protein IT261_04270 [Saprospiraceae bacterium]|nr:hypothetical protein [Saprospiraceae bacterium]
MDFMTVDVQFQSTNLRPSANEPRGAKWQCIHAKNKHVSTGGTMMLTAVSTDVNQGGNPNHPYFAQMKLK